jgi:phytoene desaturase
LQFLISMSEPHMVIVGGGLAGLATGCYARLNGWRTTIVEHNLALGGVCTAWQRGPYTIDGCIHWLTGGPFMQVYRELGIIPPVEIRPLRQFATYRHVADGTEIQVGDDLRRLGLALSALAPEDVAEIERLIEACDRMATLNPGLDAPPELATVRDRLRRLWEMRSGLGTLMHYRRTLGDWRRSQLNSERLGRFFSRLVPDEAPVFFLLFLLGYLARGQLSRPQGGAAAFRDALIERYRALGGESLLATTVEEIVVQRDRACGVRLTDGTIIDANVVVSTSSGPETVLRLLGGHYGAEATRRRLETWKLFQPIVIVSCGVSRDMSDYPATLLLDGIEPVPAGGHDNPLLTIRIFNDEPRVAPPGHTVVQVLAQTSYDWWARCGSSYQAQKEVVAESLLGRLEPYLPGLRASVQMTDVVTPLTFWRNARSWRGAYEGWMPSPEAFFGHIPKTLPGLEDFFMAGQWVEPGGGIPTALMSGRQLVQILCQRAHRTFRPT